MTRRFLPSLPYYLVYEGEVPAVEDPPKEGENEEGDKSKKTKVTFSKEQQDWINAQLAEEKRKGQAKNDQLITELETQKQRAAPRALVHERIPLDHPKRSHHRNLTRPTTGRSAAGRRLRASIVARAHSRLECP